LAVGFGFLFNVFLTASVLNKTAGEVRKRALFNLIGFFSFIIGLLFSMKLGWLKNVPSNHVETVVGNIIIAVSFYIYSLGFKTDEY
jgi:uncharacterized membrane protein